MNYTFKDPLGDLIVLTSSFAHPYNIFYIKKIRQWRTACHDSRGLDSTLDTTAAGSELYVIVYRITQPLTF